MAGSIAKTSTITHSVAVGMCVLKIGCRKGTMTTSSVRRIDRPTAYCMYLLPKTPNLKTDIFSERTV